MKSNQPHHRRTGSLSYDVDSSLRMKLCCMVGVAVYFLSMCVSANDTLEYSAYCQNLCTWGRGGNVCRCSAVHFAGKRAPEASDRELAAAATDRIGPVGIGRPENTAPPVRALLLMFMIQRMQQQQKEEKVGFEHRTDVPAIVPIVHTGLSHIIRGAVVDRPAPVMVDSFSGGGGFDRRRLFSFDDAGLQPTDSVYAAHRSPVALKANGRLQRENL